MTASPTQHSALSTQYSPDISAETLAALLEDARATTLALVADLTDAQLVVPYLRSVNPPLWEIGHVGWFQEKWALRHLRGLDPCRPDADQLYDSAFVPHDARWHLPLPGRAETLALLQQILDRVLDRLATVPPDADCRYFHRLALFHEDMHTEAIAYTRQTLGYAAPRLPAPPPANETRTATPHVADAAGPLGAAAAGPPPGAFSEDVAVPGGEFWLGATSDAPFVFDNEKWAHPVTVAPFRIARAPVTQAEFAAFVDDGGYQTPRWWSADGWAWREQVAAERPVYWERAPGGGWQRRQFDQWVPLEPHRPMLHVSWHEAQAYCCWAGRRLPSEVEWEMAAAAEPAGDGTWRKRRFPWGDIPPTPEHANLDWRAMGCVDVGRLPAGDSYFGCRQMLGNVWEWTNDTFGPYAGFVPDPYKEYSQPWFGTFKVLRGGAWTTRARLLRNTWRNFYTPNRRDVWAGFRTCAVDA
jgi:iron(II)-dependent oxidoreductase